MINRTNISVIPSVDIILNTSIYYPIGVYPYTHTDTHAWTHRRIQAYKHTDADARTEKSK